MAEVVSRNNEEMLPQFEEIIRLKLFTSSEMREIIRRHVEFEYKTVRREKHAADLQQYINYKKDFLKLVRIKMKANKVAKKDRTRIESMLVKHINKLYNMMIKYFSTDVSLWLDYIDFMIKEKDYARVVVLYDSLLGFHMGEVDLFIKAARFLIKYVKDIDLARKTLFKGIRIHRRNHLLYLEFFKIELDFALKKRRECQEDSERLSKDPVLCGKTAEVVCLSALKVISDMNFKIMLLEICAKYKFTKVLQKKIYRMLKNEHNFEPEMWKKVALLELNGINFETVDMSGLKSKDPFKERVWRCFHVFLKAVKVIPSETMWFYYIDTFFELLKTNPDKHEFINKFLLKLLPRSNVQNLLKEEHYLNWIESSEKFHSLDKLIGFIDGSLKLYPQSAKLWLKKLRYLLNQGNVTKFKQVFVEAVTNLKEEQAQHSLWQFLLQSCVDDFPSNDINEFFEEMMRKSPITYPPLRPLYLDWVIAKNDLAAARSIFCHISRVPPYNIELYEKMIAFELLQKDVNVKQIRSLYETACLYFGSSHPDLWLDFIQFEKERGDSMLVTDIYWRAVKQLEPSLSDTFITDYSLLKTG